MHIKPIALAACAAALTVCSTAAVADTVLAGTFAGIASGSRFDALSPNAVDFDGEVVTGTFSIDLSAAPLYTIDGPDRRLSVYPAGSIGLTFLAHGQLVDFGGVLAEGGVDLVRSAGAAQLYIDGDVQNPYHNALLELSGPLFDGLDIGTLRAGEVDLGRSSAGFFASRAFGSSVTLTSVTFAAAVPEPAAWWMMLAGLGGLAIATSRRTRRRRPGVAAVRPHVRVNTRHGCGEPAQES